MQASNLNEPDLNQINQFLLPLYSNTARLTVSSFMPWALEALTRILPFDSAAWGNTVGPDIIPYNLYLYNQPDELVNSYMAVRQLDPLPKKWISAKPGAAINFDTVIPKLEFNEHPLYLQHAKRFGLEYTLSTCLINPLTELRVFLSIYRANPATPFTETECQLMEFLFPHMVEARNQNILHNWRRDTVGHNPHEIGHALCDPNGFVHSADPLFVNYLTNEWHDWDRKIVLPELSALFSTPEKLRIYKGDTIVIHIYQSNDLFHLIVHKRNNIDSLSKREYTIAEMISLGITYKEIAKKLGISSSTVTSHMNNIYKKLGLRNKAELSCEIAKLNQFSGKVKFTPQ